MIKAVGIIMVMLAVAGCGKTEIQMGPTPVTAKVPIEAPATPATTTIPVTAQAPEPTPAETVKPTPLILPPQPQTTEPSMVPPMYAPWISPAKVNIGNFHEGANAEFQITFHNPVTNVTDQKVVTTGDNDNEGDIPLKSAGLYKKAIASVLSIISTEPTDKLVVKSYDSVKNKILVTGFASNKVRTITMNYIPITGYSIYARIPDNYKTESANIALSKGWVTMERTLLLMAPLETVSTTVILTMPSKATLPDKNWEFWVGVHENNNATISLEMVSRIIISMR